MEDHGGVSRCRPLNDGRDNILIEFWDLWEGENLKKTKENRK